MDDKILEIPSFDVITAHLDSVGFQHLSILILNLFLFCITFKFTPIFSERVLHAVLSGV